MKTSFVRFFAVAFIAAGSFSAVTAAPAQPSSQTAAVAGPHGGPMPTPIPVCPSCGRGNSY